MRLAQHSFVKGSCCAAEHAVDGTGMVTLRVRKGMTGHNDSRTIGERKSKNNGNTTNNRSNHRNGGANNWEGKCSAALLRAASWCLNLGCC